MSAFVRLSVRRCATCVVLAACASALSVAGQLRPAYSVSVSDSSTQAFMRADSRMMDVMEVAHDTGDADRDFVAHMAPHHHGAIDMAQAELKYGKDPALRQLASRIVSAQRDEIALMERWQKAHGKTP